MADPQYGMAEILVQCFVCGYILVAQPDSGGMMLNDYVFLRGEYYCMNCFQDPMGFAIDMPIMRALTTGWLSKN